MRGRINTQVSRAMYANFPFYFLTPFPFFTPPLLLPPPVSAALNLGCIPRRASRSQRHSNPVSYLSPSFKEPTDASPKPQDNSNPNQICSKSMLPPLLPIQSSNLHISATQFGSKYSTIGPEIHFMPSNASNAQKRSHGAFPLPMESRIWPDLGCGVYPLCYCEGHSLPQPPMNIFGAAKPSVQSNGGKTSKLNAECDLSLRLGLPSPPSSEAESSWTHEVEEVGSSGSCDGGKSCGPPSAGDTGFDFFSADHIDARHESCKWSSQGDCALYMNGCDKSQKGAQTGGALADECFSWKP